MNKINLMNDYNHTAHPRVTEAVCEAQGRRFAGYGLDGECAAAAEEIRRLTGQAAADVHFAVGGTQANLIAISAFLRPHEAVIAPESAHINIHETGAIEAAGHKILALPAADGKADAAGIRALLEEHINEHLVRPRLLFISQATELGTVYTRAELAALREVCDEHGLYIYIDGARLGYALTSRFCDMSLPEFAEFADAFYIGGTKNGLLFGEALIIQNPSLREDFRYIMKQRGGLLAKGFLLGIQFRAILKDGLYFELARQANETALRLDAELRKLDIPMLADTYTNQVFPIVNREALGRLEERAMFERWGPEGETGVPIRFVTTWQTTEEEISALLDLCKPR